MWGLGLAAGGRQRGSPTYYNSTGIAGSRRIVEFNDPITYGSDTNNCRLDAGLNFDTGYRQGPVQVQLGYGLKLCNLHQNAGDEAVDRLHNFGADAAYSRVAQLTGTYFFNL